MDDSTGSEFMTPGIKKAVENYLVLRELFDRLAGNYSSNGFPSTHSLAKTHRELSFMGHNLNEAFEGNVLRYDLFDDAHIDRMLNELASAENFLYLKF